MNKSLTYMLIYLYKFLHMYTSVTITQIKIRNTSIDYPQCPRRLPHTASTHFQDVTIILISVIVYIGFACACFIEMESYSMSRLVFGCFCEMLHLYWSPTLVGSAAIGGFPYVSHCIRYH